MTQKSGLRSWIPSMLLGSGLTFFLDPQSGRRRRALLRDKLISLSRRGSRRATGQFEHVAGMVTAAVPHQPDNPNPDDNTLRDRVESEVFRDDRIPKGDININVAEKVVELRGQLQSQDDIDLVVECVRRVPDVGGIHNYLHVPGTPAPNKEEALRAGRG